MGLRAPGMQHKPVESIDNLPNIWCEKSAVSHPYPQPPHPLGTPFTPPQKTTTTQQHHKTKQQQQQQKQKTKQKKSTNNKKHNNKKHEALSCQVVYLKLSFLFCRFYQIEWCSPPPPPPGQLTPWYPHPTRILIRFPSPFAPFPPPTPSPIRYSHDMLKANSQKRHTQYTGRYNDPGFTL